MKVAITGASGFVGNRIVEKFYLGKLHDVVPLVRSHSSLALLARFNLTPHICNHYSMRELTTAFAGCDAVVHTALGDDPERMAEAVYLAANEAGVKRLVVLSSASVYNQNPIPGTTEESPIPKKLATSYNAYKVSADKALRKLRPKGRTELVFLMPGIIYGPRSRWIANLAKQILDGTAYLVAGGNGVCNLVYVDNLVQSVHLSLVASQDDGETFFISDSETITWKDFYRPVAVAMGIPYESIHSVDPPIFTVSLPERFREQIRTTVAGRRVQSIKQYLPDGARTIYKTVMSLASIKQATEPNHWTVPRPKSPDVTLEMSLLHQCAYKLPNTKAEKLLDYFPSVTFEEGMQRSIQWLKFAGYPIL